MQGEWKGEDLGKKKQIVVTSIPYGVTRASSNTAIGEIIEDSKVAAAHRAVQ